MERRSTALVVTLGLALVLGSAGCQQTAPKSGDGDGTGDGGTEFQTDTGDVETVTPIALSDLETIYFDYDKSNIRADQRGNLQSDADAVKTREGATIPAVAMLADALGLPVILLPIGWPDDDPHSHREKLQRDQFLRGIECFVHYFAEVSRGQPGASTPAD